MPECYEAMPAAGGSFARRGSEMIAASTDYQRPSKDESFLEIAAAVSRRSTCLRRRYGAVIVSADGRIVATGYNGAPRGRANCNQLGICLREQLHLASGSHYELCRAVHAEANAVINGNPLDIAGGTLFLIGFEATTGERTAKIRPCAMCQRLILNAQIARVVLQDADGRIVTEIPDEWPDDLPEVPGTAAGGGARG